MSDPKRASLITVVDTKSAKNKVTKTVRLTINLDESNESKYPELNYKELLKAAVRKNSIENCKPAGLDPFSDNDDDLAMRAHRFEQKYGGKSTYGRKGRSKREDFADIGAGYDENDSFIDNTHGYDEIVPPECDTYYGGFYINCGTLEFKPVQEEQDVISDAEHPGNRTNKRRISSSSSEAVSTDSSSESDSQDAKDPKAIANGTVDSHKTEHRKKKNKKIDKKKPKKIRRKDSSAATSGKQTSDDNAHHGDGESADSRTSQSDSLTSKPAPSSENAITSDSSRDAEPKTAVSLPAPVLQVLEELEVAVARQLAEQPGTADTLARHEPAVLRIERILAKCCTDSRSQRAAWQRAARTLRTSRAKLLATIKGQTVPERPDSDAATTAISTASQPAASTLVMLVPAAAAPANKRKPLEELGELDITRMTPEEKEVKIIETLHRLRLLIEDRKPGMIATYNAECKRVQEERKKLQIAASSEGAPHIEKRLPKRRFPWCPLSCALLSRLAKLAGGKETAATLLATRALPLFPSGFVRMPTLLRQANLSKEIKASDLKKQRINPVSHPTGIPIQPSFIEPIQFPSSLTVTTSKPGDKNEVIDESKYKLNPEAVFGSIIHSYSLNKGNEKSEERKKETVDKSKEDVYIPPNIGSITITPVLSSQKTDRKVNNSSIPVEKPKESVIRIKSPATLNNTSVPLEKPKESLIRIKSPAVLNEMVKKEKEKLKKLEKVNASKEKRASSPLHIDTSYQSNKKEPSPKLRLEEINTKQIEAMRLAENNIPRPALIAVSHNSPTFAKPDKRPPEVKKKKEIVIVSDVDPLADNQQEPVAVDDSSSDVELIEDKDISECASDIPSDIVPSKDNVSDGQLKANCVKQRSFSLSKDKEYQKKAEQLDEETKELFDIVKANLSELEHSQEPTKSNSYGDSVINSGGQACGVTVTSTERTPMNNIDGLNGMIDHRLTAATFETDSS